MAVFCSLLHFELIVESTGINLLSCVCVGGEGIELIPGGFRIYPHFPFLWKYLHWGFPLRELKLIELFLFIITAEAIFLLVSFFPLALHMRLNLSGSHEILHM